MKENVFINSENYWIIKSITIIKIHNMLVHYLIFFFFYIIWIIVLKLYNHIWNFFNLFFRLIHFMMLIDHK